MTKQFRVITDHGGVLIPHEDSYTYFEKAGGSGPFIRLDFTSRDELIPYLECYIRDAKTHGDMTAFLLTFNDKEVKQIWPEQHH